MITANAYTNALRDLGNIDLSSTWVSFERKLLGDRYVVVPQFQQKPAKFLRFIYRLLRCLGIEMTPSLRPLRIADDLTRCIQISVEICKPTPAALDLQNRIYAVAASVLEKIQAAHPSLALRQLPNLQEMQQQQLAAEALREEQRQQKQQREQAAQQLQEERRLQKQQKLQEERQLEHTICANWTLTAQSREIAFSMDWDKDDPLLFDPTYLNDLFERLGKHADMQNPLISIKDKNTFINFLYQLMTGATIKDHYGKILSKENTDRLRQMMLAIMNLVNAQRREPGFAELYATVVSQICLAIDNCSNRINTEIEAVFYSLSFPKEGSLGQRVKLALQQMRGQVFQQSIHTLILESDQPGFYLEHEAASFNYYYGIMNQEFGLPPSVSGLDKRFQKYALQGQEQKLRALFSSGFNSYTAAKEIAKIVNNSFDPTISTKQFTDWVELRYPNEMYAFVDEEGLYRPEGAVLNLLLELELLKPSVPPIGPAEAPPEHSPGSVGA